MVTRVTVTGFFKSSHMDHGYSSVHRIRIIAHDNYSHFLGLCRLELFISAVDVKCERNFDLADVNA